MFTPESLLVHLSITEHTLLLEFQNKALQYSDEENQAKNQTMYDHDGPHCFLPHPYFCLRRAADSLCPAVWLCWFFPAEEEEGLMFPAVLGQLSCGWGGS